MCTAGARGANVYLASAELAAIASILGRLPSKEEYHGRQKHYRQMKNIQHLFSDYTYRSGIIGIDYFSLRNYVMFSCVTNDLPALMACICRHGQTTYDWQLGV